MIIEYKYLSVFCTFESEDKELIKKVGLDRFFEIQADKEVFDLSNCQFYNGEIFFMTYSNDIICIDCLKEDIDYYIAEIDCFSFLIEDLEENFYCSICSRNIEPQYGPDKED